MGRFDQRATAPRRGVGDILRWKVLDPKPKPRDTSGSDAPTAPFVTPRREPDRALIQSGEPSITWIGHASFLLSLGGLRVLIDPIFRPRLGLAPRLTPPGLALADLPPIDVVVITHNHRDHMDPWTIERLGPAPLYVAPVGNGRLLKRFGAKRVVELDWWESTTHENVSITIVPARHWSMHFPWDRNESLWGGCVLRAAEGAAYHSGDTAYFDGFAEIGRRLGPIDWAMLPIGAYEPRWFMEPQHMCPEEAVRAWVELGAKTLVAMHWGTFRLTDEPTGEPPVRARAAFADQAGATDEDRLWILDVGESRRL